jgi:chromatin remodeling complex protein RSC6
MTTTTAPKAAVAKRVAKKTEAPAAATPAPVAAAAAAEPVQKIKRSVATKAAETAAPAAVPTASPVADATPAAEVPQKSFSEEVSEAIEQLTTIKNNAVAAIATFKRLEKRYTKDVNAAKKRKRVKKEGSEANATERKPSVFVVPVRLADSLAKFLGQKAGAMMSPADVTKAFKVYIDEHKLKGEKHSIIPDSSMCSVLGISASEVLTWRTIQKYLHKLYIKEKKPTTTA